LKPVSTGEPVHELTNRVIDYERKRKTAVKLEKREPPTEAFLGTAFSTSIAALVFVALGLRTDPSSSWSFVWQVLAELCLLIGFGCVLLVPRGLLYAIRQARPTICDRFAFLLRDALDRDAEDFRFIDELQRDYDINTLQFLAKRWASRMTQRLEDYGLAVGTPSQLKVFLVLIPLVQLGVSPSFKPFIHKNEIPFWVLALCYVVVLSLALRDYSHAKRIEELRQLLELAVERKKQSQGPAER